MKKTGYKYNDFNSLFLFCRISIVLFTSLSIYPIVNAQQVNTKLYTTNDGLPTTSIFGCYEDSNGYLWIGTANGISRFDGKQFVNFNLADGLPSLFVDKIFEDSRRRLWAGTRHGMARLLGNKFVTYPLSDKLDIDYVFNIIETNDKQVWALTNRGIYQFEVNTWKKIKLFPGFENEACRSLIETDSGLCVNYGHLLAYRNNRNEWKVLGQHYLPWHNFNVLYKHGETLLVSTWDAIYRVEKDRLIPVIEGLKGSGYFTFFIDKQNRLWYYFTEGDKAFHISSSGNYQEFSLQIPNLYGQISITKEDTHGNFWAGTQEGLLKIQEVAFSTIEETENTKVGAATNGIALNDSSLLFSTPDGFYSYNPSSGNEKAISERINKTIIDFSAKDEKKRIWFITRNNQLYRLDNRKLTDFSFLLNNLRAGEMFHCSYDMQKKKLLIICNSGLVVGDDKKMERFILFNKDQKLPWCTRILAAKNGTIFLKAPPENIYIIDINDSLYEWKETNQSHKNYTSFYESPENDIWITDAATGLLQYRFNKKGKLELVNMISDKEGLQNKSINSVTFDSLQRVWVATNSGLDILQKNNSGYWEVFNYSKDAGLNVNWGQAKLITDAKGDVWLTSWHKLVRFDCSNIKLKKETPKVIIEKVQLNSKDVDWRKYTDSLYGYRQFPVAPKLSYADNTITILFNGISFSSSPRLEYAYQLNPVDSSWGLPTSNASVSFVNLPPGKYLFKVRTRDQASEWSLPAEFSFTIIAPFWMRWWFITLCVATIASIIYAIFKYRVTQLKNIITLRTKISQDLHDEIGASISGINLLSQMAAEQLDDHKPEAASEYLFKVKTYTQDVIEKLSDMVWVFNPQNDSIEKLLQRLRSFAIPIAVSKNIRLHFETDKEGDTKNLSISQRKAIYLISKEAMNNIFKYAGCNNIYYSLHTKASKWQLRIQDNGQGFNIAENRTGNGLKNMQARAEEIGATFNIESQNGNGTTITVVF